MENIKYRAWYEDSLDGIWKMANVRDIIWNCGVVVIDVFTDDNRLFYQPLNFKLMHYIGIKDSEQTEKHPKGQEIYEADICQITQDCGEVIVGEVVWDDRYLRYALDIGSELWDFGNIIESNYPIEVIGDAHHNPELIPSY